MTPPSTNRSLSCTSILPQIQAAVIRLYLNRLQEEGPHPSSLLPKHYSGIQQTSVEQTLLNCKRGMICRKLGTLVLAKELFLQWNDEISCLNANSLIKFKPNN